MIPGELDFVLDLLGFEWPNVNEDAVRDAATLVRGLREDLQGTLDTLDDRIDGELAAAFKSKAATAYIEAWTENRTQNMDQLLDVLPEAAGGIDIISDAIVALKTKVIVELGITAAQIAAAAASAVITLGASAAATAAIIVARKKALDVLTDLAVEELFARVAIMVIEPLTGTVASLAMAMIDAPLTSSGGADVPVFDADYAVMLDVADALDDAGVEQREIGMNFAANVSALPIFAE